MPVQALSREYRIYLALWRKALKQDEMVIIKASNLALAVAMRQGMYRAIRPFRGSDVDKELAQASEKFVLYLVRGEEKTDPHFIEIRDRKTLAELENMFDDLGISEDDLDYGDERTLRHKLQASLEQMEAPAPSKTKFYERD